MSDIPKYYLDLELNSSPVATCKCYVLKENNLLKGNNFKKPHAVWNLSTPFKGYASVYTIKVFGEVRVYGYTEARSDGTPKGGVNIYAKAVSTFPDWKDPLLQILEDIGYEVEIDYKEKEVTT
jgi:hypothetical protein